VSYVTLRSMTRHTTFRFCLDPTIEQQMLLTRYAGASRFAYNQCLRIVKTGLSQRKRAAGIEVPWTGFDLIYAFNSWKRTEDAGRVFAVDTAGNIEVEAIGLAWRNQVCQQVFEEAAVDCARALAAWSDSRSGKRRGRRVGFPGFKKKSEDIPSFRLRNKYSKSGKPAIRVGDDQVRSVTLPRIGSIAVHDDTRRLRRMLAKHRAKICFATVSHRAGRWWLALNVEAADLHGAHRHRARADADLGGWVGVDRGLSAFAVAATVDGVEVLRADHPPRALARGMRRQRRLSRSLSRKQKGSRNRHDAAARLARHHRRVANTRRHFLHQASNALVKTHDRLVIEDLNVTGMLRNHRLAQAISDAGWSEFARMVRYKQDWRGGAVQTADRWYPSSQLCSHCGARNIELTLADRVFDCACGHSADRDLNAAVNLARWAENKQDQHRSPDPQAGGRVTNVRRRDGADQHTTRVGETSPNDAGTEGRAAPAA
jgi:putative transposase